jgi:hypothetical protein
MAPPSPNLTKSPSSRRPRRTSPTPPPADLETDLPGWKPQPEPDLTTVLPESDDPGSAGPGSPEPAPTPERPTRAFRLIDPATRAALFEAAGAILTTIGSILQLRFANPAHYGPNEVWLADKQDIDVIGGSLANLAARRVPDGLTGSSDAADLISLGIGTFGYGAKNLTRRSQLAAALTHGGWSDLERAAADTAGVDGSAGDISQPVG